ncbi:PAS domain S-box protein [Methanoregula formicica]|nr:PAS domain S-box protein [Methanoregula formicica]
MLQAFRQDPGQFRIDTAATLKKAREVIAHECSDLIIADWNLPDGRGIDIISREDGRVTTPVIVMTGYGDERLAVEIMKSGAVDYIVKSATVFEDLPNISRRAIRFWENIQERVRAEHAEQETQKRLGDILAFLPDPVLAIDTTGTVIAWNNAMENLTGVPAADMLGKGDHEYSIPFYGERRPLLIDLVLEPDTEILNRYPFVQRDGDRIMSETFVAGIYGGKGAYLWGTATHLYDTSGNRVGAIEVIRDITERKKTEEIVRASEGKFRSLVEEVPDFILVHRNGKLLFVNRAASESTGYVHEDLIGRSMLDFIVPEDRERVVTSIEKRLKGEPLIPYEVRILTSTGQERQVIVRGNLIEFEGSPASLNVLTDVTEMRKSEKQLLLKNIVFEASITANSISDIEGIMTDVNPAFLAIWGYRDKKEVIGKPFGHFFTEGDAASEVLKTLDTSGRWSGELVARRADGSTFIAFGTATQTIDDKGNKIGYQSTCLDVSEQKQAEAALQKSEAKFRDLFNTMSSGVVIYEPVSEGQDFIIRDINRAVEWIENVRKENVVGKSVLSVFPGVVEFGLFAVFQRVAETGYAEAFPVSLYKDNRISGWRDNYVYRLESGEIVAIYEDVTEKKQAEEAVRQNETRFSALIQNSSDIIRVLDREGKITYESDSAERILGYPRGSLIGKDPMDYIHPDDRELVRQDLQGVFDQTNSGIPTEFRIRKADGGYIWVEARANNLLDVPGVNGIVVTTRLIQQRKEAEDAIRESEQRLRLALEGADVGFWDWHLPSGTAVFSDRYYTMLGYEPREFPATIDTWTALLHPDDKKRVVADLERQIREGESQLEIEYRIRIKDGSWLWILGRGKVVEKDENGIPIRITGVNIDITNRRLLESEVRSLNVVLEQRVKDRTEALSKANEALEEENMQRLDAEGKLKESLNEKTMLLKEIHHRVKNNLQIIVSLLNLQSRYVKDESVLATIRESQNRVKAMALVHEKLYRAEDIAHIDLNDYIRFLGTGLSQFYDAKSRGIRFSLESPDVRVDINTAIPLGLILNELISNAFKYAFPKGKSGEVFVSVTREEKTLTVIVRDDGAGIPEDFDWKNTQSLGLRLVNSLVDQLDGTIELDRSKGTRFTMVLHEKG